MAIADEWYDDWFARVNRQARSPWMRKRLEQELAHVRRDTEASGERAFDEETERLRQQLHDPRLAATA